MSEGNYTEDTEPQTAPDCRLYICVYFNGWRALSVVHLNCKAWQVAEKSLMLKVFVCFHYKNDFDNDNDITLLRVWCFLPVWSSCERDPGVGFPDEKQINTEGQKRTNVINNDSLTEELQCVCFRNDTEDIKSCTIRGGEADENKHEKHLMKVIYATTKGPIQKHMLD